jgi:RHS repeat-associated protein
MSTMDAGAVTEIPVKRRSPRWRRRLAAVMPVVLAISLIGPVPAAAKPPKWKPPVPKTQSSVPVVPVKAGARAATGGQPNAQTTAPTWPAAASATVSLGSGPAASNATGAAPAAPVRAGALPVWVGQGSGQAAGLTANAAPVGSVNVRLYDRAATGRANVNGVLLSVQRADGVTVSGPLTVRVDYGAFAGAYGGDYATRLRLVRLPACALTKPDDDSCRQATPVAFTNDSVARTLTAQVAAEAASPTVLAATAGPTGDNGDYKATSLSPSAQWQVSTQSGDFSWTYQLRTPPALGGPAPQLALTYASGSIDGRTGATNNQSSWVGDGWDLSTGFIERSYRACADDTDAVRGVKPNNVGHPTGDLCWATDNATMSLNGQATPLVRDDNTKVWRPKNDDGTRVERLTDAARANGDNDNEYWRVTAPNGTQYIFGQNRLPGWQSGKPTTDSVWTVPVFGNHPGEPCHASTFAAGWCQQAWRWQLDYVIDPHDNTMAYYYRTENGAYGRDLDGKQRTNYIRSGWLDHIDYSMRAGSEYGSAPMRVNFAVADRCLANCWNAGKATAASWPETPWDQDCPTSPCTTGSPTFWSTKRLTSVTTQVWIAAAVPAGYRDVDVWTLRQEFLDSGTAKGEGTPMWLRGVTHAGKAGPVVTLPEVTFDPGGNPFPNRVKGPSNGRTELMRWRLQVITSESGGQIVVRYKPGDCTSTTLPAPESNGKRCMPVWWSPPGVPEGIDWFHKYVVGQVTAIDGVADAPNQDTYYDYLDAPAWRYDTSEMTPDKRRTWSDWRGFSRVSVRAGANDRLQTKTDFVYLRGLGGTFTNLRGGTVTDVDALQGFLREQITYSGVGGAELSATINDPVTRGPTATRTSPWGTVQAWMTNTETVRTRTALAAGGVRTTSSTTTFNNDGLPILVDDNADTAINGDDQCVRTTYAVNDGAGIRDKVARTETLSVSCGQAKTPADPATVISDKRTFYDDPNTFAAAPTKGDAVRTEEVRSFAGTTPSYVTTTTSSYDAYGRVLEASDALKRTTTTTYTPATGGPLTGRSVTNPLNQTTTTTLDPAYGLPVTVIDPNGARTDEAYDGLGQLTAVWLPGRATTATPSIQFSYDWRNTTPTTVTTRHLLPTGNTYRTTTTLYDGQLRTRQVQTQATGGGRTLVDTAYDDRGNIAWTSNPYFNGDSGPNGTLVTTKGQPQIPAYHQYTYDGANRKIVDALIGYGVERARTTVAHGGDHTDTTPPAGGTATSVYTDARGRITKLLQYHGPTPAGDADVTTYTYTPAGDQASITDPAGITWRYGYDLRGFKIRTDDPDRGITNSTFNDAGELLTTADSRGVTLSFTYDKLGRKTGEYNGAIEADNQLAGWAYDTVANGVGRLSSSTRYVGGANGSRYTTTIGGYDPASGKVLSTSVTLPAAEGALAGTYTVTNTYKPDGSLNTSTLPAAGNLAEEKLYHTYTDVGLPATVFSASTNYVYAVTYNKIDQLTQRVLGNFGKRTWLTYTYDDITNLLTDALVTPELKSDATHDTYAYDPAGNVTKQADTVGPKTDTQCYRYDYLRRLTNAWTPGNGDCAAAPSVSALDGPAPYWRSYTYDVTGNRLTEVLHNATGDVTKKSNFPASSNRQPHTLSSVTTTGAGAARTDSYTYDAAGNTTTRSGTGGAQKLTWDPEGHLATSTENGATTSYLYDADGNRLLRKGPDGTTASLPGGTELHLAPGATSGTGTRYYDHQGASIAVRTASTLTYTHGDSHNTTGTEINSLDLGITKRRSDPFGVTRGDAPTSWAGEKGFVGGTVDKTGTIHLGAREYDPDTGRFLSLDPVIDASDPQQLHGYAYANNAPPTFVDADGRWTIWGAVKSAAKAVKTAAVNTVNSIKNDPLGFVRDVAIGVAAAALVAAVCSTGIGCVILAGAVSGAAVAAVHASHEVAANERPYSAKDYAKDVALGAVIGAGTAGVGAGLGAAGKKIRGNSGVAEADLVGEIDPFASDLSRKVVEVRKGLANPESGKNAAIFEYEQGGVLKHSEVTFSEFGKGHSERLIWKDLQEKGVKAGDVKRIYTEFEPCITPTPAAGCKRFIEKMFPQAKVTHSFPYGDKASRAFGKTERAKHFGRIRAI